ncbi:MAG TPA: hypothetical protein VGO47_03510 [Chlamydiales bacterium]|nr:hypothetical protein [Chlamydiales bacterium]
MTLVWKINLAFFVVDVDMPPMQKQKSGGVKSVTTNGRDHWDVILDFRQEEMVTHPFQDNGPLERHLGMSRVSLSKDRFKAYRVYMMWMALIFVCVLCSFTCLSAVEV